MEKHLAKFDMLQCDQRGGRRGTWGVMDNLLIDRMILEECRMRNKNLNCAWVDVAKAYDSVKLISFNATNWHHRFTFMMDEN